MAHTRRAWMAFSFVACVVASCSARAAAQASDDCIPYARGCFLDTNGRWENADTAYLAWNRPHERHPWRALIEEALFLGVGTTWYYLDPTNQFDWDRPRWRERFTHEGVRFDNNAFPINFAWHPWSGAAYYGFPRANGLSLPAAAAMGTMTSYLWEYVLEFNEKVSVNDIITTPITGIALGEFIVRLAQYLNRAPGGGRRGQRALAWTLGVSQAIHDRMDVLPAAPEDAAADDLGFSSRMFHRFDVALGGGWARTAERPSLGFGEFTLGGRFVAIPGYLRPGTFRGYFGDGNVTSLRSRTAVGSSGTSFEVSADTMLLGWYGQSIRLVPFEGTRGWALIAGTSLGYGYLRQDFADFRDLVGTVRFPGVAIDADALLHRVALHVEARAHPEFAGVYAGAFPAWRELHPDVQTKTILDRWGYYYGWGWSGRLAMRVDARAVSFGGAVERARYRSQQGFDRFQEAITFDVHAHDHVLDAEVWLRVHPVALRGAYVEVGAGRRQRASDVGGLVHEGHFDRVYARVGRVF